MGEGTSSFQITANSTSFCGRVGLKKECLGQRRVSKAIVLLSKDTEKTLRSERGPDRVAPEGF